MIFGRAQGRIRVGKGLKMGAGLAALGLGAFVLGFRALVLGVRFWGREEETDQGLDEFCLVSRRRT